MDQFSEQRLDMVDRQISARGVTDERVLAAVRSIPRHLFVAESMRKEAYADHPIEIGYGQTISQPYVVASMTENLNLADSDLVLEVGTGCGYQTAVLASVAGWVYSIERLPELSALAEDTLREINCRNATLRVGDGTRGWPEHAPYDAIIVTAAAREIPPALTEQLRIGGRMILPYDTGRGQYLLLVNKSEQGLHETILYPVRFVPLISDS